MPRIERSASAAERLASPQSEADISAAIRLALGSEPDLVLWRQSVGVFAVLDEVRGEVRTQRAGLPKGSADLVGILSMPCALIGDAPCAERRRVGRFFALEVKTRRGVVSDDQRKWHALVYRHGGFVAVVRSVDDARAALARARAGLCE